MFAKISSNESHETIIPRELAAAGIRVVPDTMVGYQGKGDKRGSLLDHIFIIYEREDNSYSFIGSNIPLFMVEEIKRVSGVVLIKKSDSLIEGKIKEVYSLKIVADIIGKELSVQYKA